MTSPSNSELTSALERALSPPLRTISRVLDQAGYGCWAVGGCVRDIALSLIRGDRDGPARLSDWDLATSAPPSEVQRLFRRTIPTGLQHGTVTILLDGQQFEVTTLRGERGHSDGRRPDEVFFVDDIVADLARRDFTVNAIAYDMANGTLHDPFSGLSDLSLGRLRAVGNPADRFAEDGLRVLRCARFCATLGFTIEPETAQAIRPSLASFEKVAQERVQQEWLKALSSPEPGRFFQAALEHGLLHVTTPWLFAGTDSLIAPRDTPDALDRLTPPTGPSPSIYRLAFLVAAGTSLQSTVPEQLDAAERAAQSTARRLKLSREQAQELQRYAAHHLLPPTLSATGPAAARRYLAHLGRVHWPAVSALQRDVARWAPSIWTEDYQRLTQVLTEDAQSSAALSLQELAVDGRDLIELGIPKGPGLGKILQTLLEHVLDDPQKNDRQGLLAHAQRLYGRGP